MLEAIRLHSNSYRANHHRKKIDEHTCLDEPINVHLRNAVFDAKPLKSTSLRMVVVVHVHPGILLTALDQVAD